MAVISKLGHARACPGHPRLNSPIARKTWMAGTSPAMTKRDTRLAGKCSRHHFLQNLPAGGFVGEGSVAPPPAVLLHLLGRGDEPIGNLRKICIRIIRGKDQPTAPTPAQRKWLEPQIILKHQMVARRLAIMDKPDRRKVANRDRQMRRGQLLVQPPRPLIPDAIETAVDR